jgi:hypothetical protein
VPVSRCRMRGTFGEAALPPSWVLRGRVGVGAVLSVSAQSHVEGHFRSGPHPGPPSPPAEYHGVSGEGNEGPPKVSRSARSRIGDLSRHRVPEHRDTISHLCPIIRAFIASHDSQSAGIGTERPSAVLPCSGASFEIFVEVEQSAAISDR